MPRKAVARTRRRDWTVRNVGTYQDLRFPPPVTYTESAASGDTWDTDDVIGNFPNANAFNGRHVELSYPALYGTQRNAFNQPIRIMSGFPVGYRPAPADPNAAFAPPTSLEMNNYAWKIFSETNPSAPNFSLPTFIGELKDMPSLVKNWYGLFRDAYPAKLAGQAGRRWSNLLKIAPEIAASGHLTWRWAIAPFVRDLKLMMRFQELVENKMKEIKRLSEGKRLNRRITLGFRTSEVTEPAGYFHSFGAMIYGRRNIQYSERTWGTCQYEISIPDYLAGWLRDKPAKTRYHDNAARRAMRIVTGLTAYEALATAWELTPWSWLIDWFTGFGTVINACNNTLNLQRRNACLMREAKAHARFIVDPSLTDGWVSLRDRSYFTKFTRKERYVVAAPTLAFAPSYTVLFKDSAWSILRSLYILQSGPSIRRTFQQNVQR